MERYEDNQKTDSEGYYILRTYLNEYTQILKNLGVEIIEGHSGECYNPAIHLGIKRVEVANSTFHNRVCRVYNDAYVWGGKPIKKMDVEVSVYNINYNKD